MKIGKIGKHCIKYGSNNHNVNMCKMKKKEELIVAAAKPTP
jgi:hypothetical protein